MSNLECNWAGWKAQGVQDRAKKNNKKRGVARRRVVGARSGRASALAPRSSDSETKTRCRPFFRVSSVLPIRQKTHTHFHPNASITPTFDIPWKKRTRKEDRGAAQERAPSPPKNGEGSERKKKRRTSAAKTTPVDTLQVSPVVRRGACRGLMLKPRAFLARARASIAREGRAKSFFFFLLTPPTHSPPLPSPFPRKSKTKKKNS
jgi:hypothetical protein